MQLPLELPDNDWRPVVDAWAASAAGQQLQAFLADEAAAGATVYPPQPLRALMLTPLQRTRVVILGQDPYHGPGQAEGLSFSVPEGVPFPPSLRNIFKEIQRDLGKPFPPSGSLVRWAEGGTLLLNAVLSVRDGAAASHANRGWEPLTDAIIRAAAEDPAPKVFMLWGNFAQAKEGLIRQAGQDHLVLKANHPSPLSALKPPRPFIGCGHFSTAKAWLEERGRGVPPKG
ncbi:MAG: uracil-DNA glycosylase [Roseateles depolymerans]|uniref:Uracil-DNA glycosylase n=1 Tax=Roseateles depolymerans TaxID=76731 RepID=A0A2W5FBU5_9BURK|nr:MAG: uracil-DNA glycosylase [Roseateles depolymerans]